MIYETDPVLFGYHSVKGNGKIDIMLILCLLDKLRYEKYKSCFPLKAEKSFKRQRVGLIGQLGIMFSCTPDRVFSIFTRFNKAYLLSLYRINFLICGSDKNRIASRSP